MPGTAATDKHYLGKIVLTVLLAAAALALAFSRQFYDEAMIDAFFAFALVSVVIIHLRVRPRWLDLGLMAAGTLILAGVNFQILHYPPRAMAWLSFLGLTSFVILAARSIWSRDSQDRRMLLYGWVPAALFVMSDYFASNMLEWTANAHPKTLDLYLFSFDGSLRVLLPFFVGQYYSTVPWFHISALLAYVGLAIPIAVVYAGRLVRFREGAFQSMLAFLVTGPVGILFYNLFPACGPSKLFGQAFPFHLPLSIADLPRLAMESVPIGGPRNAIPSLHLAWTLLAWWYSRGLSRIERMVAFAFLTLTALATLGTGEHWFVDLVVAFPFALMIQAACAYRVSWKEPTRVSAFALGLGGTIGWLLMLRFGTKLFWTSPIVPWALIVATIALVCLRQAKLDGVVDREVPAAAVSPANPSETQPSFAEA